MTATHQAPLGDHVVAVNNVVHSGGYPALPVGSGVSNNVVTAGNWFYPNPVSAAFVGKAGTYGAANILVAHDPPTAVFVDCARDGGVADARLIAGSPAIGAGTATLPGDLSLYPDLVLPKTDLVGVPYSTAAPSAGAYAYVPKPVCTTAPPQ